MALTACTLRKKFCVRYFSYLLCNAMGCTTVLMPNHFTTTRFVRLIATLNRLTAHHWGGKLTDSGHPNHYQQRRAKLMGRLHKELNDMCYYGLSDV